MFTVQISVSQSSFREEVSLHFHGFDDDRDCFGASTGFMPYSDALELLSAIITGRDSIRVKAWHDDKSDEVHVSIRSMIGGSLFSYSVNMEDGLEWATQAMHDVLRLKARK